MRPNCCHVSFAFLLKLLNFLQAFIGVSIIVYSVWMLDQWNHRPTVLPPTAAPAPYSPVSVFFHSHERRLDGGVRHELNKPFGLTDDLVSGAGAGFGFSINTIKLPAPWFIYSFMGVGILFCCVTLIGCIAAEAIHGCCLCFYTVLITIFVLLEAALVAFIAIDRSWEEDIPVDPTGELQSLRSFIEKNADICKWVGTGVVIIQALSLLLAIVLRGMVSVRRRDADAEDVYESGRGRPWEPLLNAESRQGDNRGTHADIWSSRMREKYGLNSVDKYNSQNQSASASVKSK